MFNDENTDTTNNVPLEKGRFLVSLVIGLFIFEELMGIFLGAFSVSRILVGALSLFLVYEGYGWARILTAILAVLGGLLGLVSFPFFAAQKSSWAELLAVISISAACLVIASILIYSKSAIAFLEMRKQEPKI